MQVTFVNEPTGEYQYYEVTFKATRPGVISTIDLVTPVRQSVHHKIKLDNPLPQAVIFAASCNVQEVLMPSTLNVPPNSSVSTFMTELVPAILSNQIIIKCLASDWSEVSSTVNIITNQSD